MSSAKFALMPKEMKVIFLKLVDEITLCDKCNAAVHYSCYGSELVTDEIPGN